MTAKKTTKKSTGAQTVEAPFAYAGLERIFHERGRLAVCTCLIAHPDGMSFTELQDACGLTDGNLSRHLHALAEMDIVSIARQSGVGRPTSICRITKSGRARFLAYVDELESVVRDVHDRAQDAKAEARGRAVPRLATT
jgi:predicted ArsR family transcriptional regulator